MPIRIQPIALLTSRHSTTLCWRFLSAEYPSVQHPIETYCFLVYSLETDFTSGLHSYLGISERLVWDTFSALHSGRADGSYLQFDDKLKKDEVAPVERKGK